MNSRLLFTLIPLAGLLFSGCKKSENEKPAESGGNATPLRPDVSPLPEPAAPDEPSENEKKLAQQLEEMQTRQLELELKLEEEKLARTEAEIKKERDLLEKEREAWRLEQELAAAKAAPEATGNSPAAGSVPSSGPGFDYQMFYDDLAPLGSWYDSADYGYVWQPTVCVTDNTWRPYTLGSWANSDQGWTWCSDEPFGWACYHYGRWAKLRGRGWVWVPGDQWAPSWVSWRRNDDYIGWCPLPPETVYHREYTWGSTIDRDCGIHPGSYVFMPVKHFDRPCRNYCEVPAACVTIFASTVNITNIIVRPGRVECHGPKYDWINERVRRPLPRYKLTCDADTKGWRDRGPRMEKDRLYCYAPRVKAPWNTQLRPSRHAALDKLEVLRAEGGLPDSLAGRYKSEKTEREKETGNLKGGAKLIAERQQRLASLEQTRASLQEQLARENASVRPRVPDNSAVTAAERPDRLAKPQDRPARPQPADSAPVVAGPVVKTPDSTVPAQPGLIARQPEDVAASKAQLEQKRKEAEAALRRETAATDKSKQDKQSALRAQLEETRRRQQEAAAARNQNAASQPATEAPRQAPETASRDDSNARTEAASREMDRQSALRAQLEEKRRLQQEAQAKQARARAETMEKQQAAETAVRAENSRNEAASRELDKHSALRAQLEEKRRQQQEAQNEQAAAQRTAMESQRRQEEAAAKAEQQARQREAMEQQRAAIEQQRRQAEEMQRRQQAEAETRQRQIQEEQRRNAEEQLQRRQAEEMQRRQQQEAETRQRQIQEEQRRNAEEQMQRRQAEEMQRRQQQEAETRQRQIQEEQRRNAEEQQRRQAEEQERGRGKR